MAKILISGGSGFIGSHVVDRLVERKHEILVFDNFSTGKRENLARHFDNPDVKIEEGDIIVELEVMGAFETFKPQIVIHLAAQAAITTAEQNPGKDLLTNAYGTLTMLRWAQSHRVKRFVYASTSAVYGHKLLAMSEHTTNLCPDNYYGVSKLAGEMYCRVMDVPTTILRFGNVYGPRQVPIGENQVIARMMRFLMFNDPFFIFGDGHQKRDFVYVEDLAEAVVKAAEDDRLNMNNVYNVAGGQSYSMNGVSKAVADLWGYKDRWQYKKSRMDPRTNSRMAVDLIEQELDWKPKTNLRAGLQKTIEWWKDQ